MCFDVMTPHGSACLSGRLTLNFSRPIAWRHVFQPSDPVLGYYKSGNGGSGQHTISCFTSLRTFWIFFSRCDAFWCRRFRASRTRLPRRHDNPRKEVAPPGKRPTVQPEDAWGSCRFRGAESDRGQSRSKGPVCLDQWPYGVSH